MSEPINHHTALIYVMVTMSAVDSEENLVGASRECMTVLSGETGLDSVLAQVKEALPKKLYETAYALAVEVAAADLSVQQEELRFLQMLRDNFNLDKLAIAAIEHSAKARHQTA